MSGIGADLDRWAEVDFRGTEDVEDSLPRQSVSNNKKTGPRWPHTAQQFDKGSRGEYQWFDVVASAGITVCGSAPSWRTPWRDARWSRQRICSRVPMWRGLEAIVTAL